MNTNVLRIDSSLFGRDGVSSQLISSVVETLQSYREVDVITRDLSKGDIPHFSAATIEAINQGNAELADTLIAEIQKADVIVIGAPMYNFGIPSELKAWFDHIARAKVTFEYNQNGPVGLLKGKKVYVVTTRGGVHKGLPTDVEVPFLKTMLGFLGLDDVEFIYAEGLSMSEHRENSIALAKAEIKQTVNL